jgi:ABC-type glycerol-3-phosphate transport system substrate-binding protein
MAADFNQQNPWGIQVEAMGQVSYGVLFERMAEAVTGGNRPELVIALPEQARVWDRDGYVADLTPYVSDPAYGWSPEEVRDFPAPFWLQDSAGERRLALPFQRTARFLLWNKTWAAELGYLEPPDTPEDFRTQACKATESLTTDLDTQNDGLGGWLIDTDAMTALSWMQAFEGGVMEGDDYRFLTPNNIRAFTFLRKLQEEGCAWMAAPEADPLAAFASRRALFLTASLEQFPDVGRAFGASGNTDALRVVAGDAQDEPAGTICHLALHGLAGLEGERCAGGKGDGPVPAAQLDGGAAGRLRLQPPAMEDGGGPDPGGEHPAAACVLAQGARNAGGRVHADVPREPAERAGAGDPGADGVDVA